MSGEKKRRPTGDLDMGKCVHGSKGRRAHGIAMSEPSSALSSRSHHETPAASARRFVNKAFACHEERDWAGFVMYACTAIELLTKAVLAKVNVLLIADGRNENSIIALTLSDPSKGFPVSYGLSVLKPLCGVPKRLPYGLTTMRKI